VIHLLQVTRWRLVDLATRRPDRRMIFRQLTSLEDRLCNALAEQGRWDDARSMLEGSLRESERLLLKDPGARCARPWQHHHLFRLAILAQQRGNLEESERLFRRAIALAERWSGPGPEDIALVTPAEDRRSLARLLACQDRHKEIRPLLLANLREVDAVPRELVDEHVVALRVMTRLDFAHFRAGDPPAPTDPDAAEPLTRLASPDCDRLSPDEWAVLVLQALDGPGGAGTGRARESSAGFRFAHLFCVTASDQRRWDQLDLAGRTADRMLALARLLVERHPENPDSHLVLADAYQQLNKNAWQRGDRAAIVPYLERAIAENRRALILDPNSEDARYAMERRQRRLKDLLAPEPEARAGLDGSRGL
jgi:tetratricopeptide (TPR) repeat protein